MQNMTIPNAGEDGEQQKLSAMLGGKVKSIVTLEDKVSAYKTECALPNASGSCL
jgi:hypothetical protein